MRYARLARPGLLLVASMLATVALGWMGIIFVAVTFALIDGGVTAPGEAAVGAASSWAAIIIFTAARAGADPITVIGAAVEVPVLLIPLVAVLFVAGLAWSSAAVMLLVRDLPRRARQRVAP